MIDPLEFIDILKIQRINYFYGVPDSLLKPLCTKLLKLSSCFHQISTNEAMAVSSAIGSFLATGDMACVYMQNSGLGNTINPLVSLASREVYSIPMLLLIGWRGELLEENQQIKDEPQHSYQGKITLNQLEILNIPYIILSKGSSDWRNKVSSIIKESKKKSIPVSIVFRKNTFSESDDDSKKEELTSYSLTREEIIEIIGRKAPSNVPIFSTTGMASRELNELREKQISNTSDFLTVGGMGCASSIALGFLRASKRKKIICIDGDGAILMHMGSLFKVSKQKGFIHFVINNNSHDSVGGQSTNAYEINFEMLGKSLGYEYVSSLYSRQKLHSVLSEVFSESHNKSSLIEVRVKKGYRKNLGRPSKTPKLNKENFIKQWSNL
tara:strand:- start:215 stop:1360 length:1146 start_codon:yes stop_codon:yes gene_type:complete